MELQTLSQPARNDYLKQKASS